MKIKVILSDFLTHFSVNNVKFPSKSAIRSPFLVALEEYVGPMPFFVVPNDAFPFSSSCIPSTF